MADYPGNSPLPPPFLGTMTQPYCGRQARAFAGLSPASGAWGTANTAVFVPFWIPFAYNVKRIWWVNGSAAGGNTDVGVYSKDGTLIVSAGSTAESGNSAPQFVTPTETLLLPGSYYFAMNHSAVTANHVNRSTALTAEFCRMIGLLTQAVGATALPATATFAANGSNTIYPVCGVTWTASGF